MKNLILLSFMCLFSYSAMAQTEPPFGCTPTDPCNLICNGGILDIANNYPIEPPGCRDELYDVDGILGWYVTGGSPGYMHPECQPGAWLDYTPLDTSNGMMFIYELGTNTESIMTGANTTVNKHYLFSYFRMSGRITSNDQHTKIEIGDVDDVINHPTPNTGAFHSTVPVFSTSQTILEEGFSIDDWEQTVICFQSDANTNVLNIRGQADGAGFSATYFDNVEMIEDKLITNAANIQTVYSIDCGTDDLMIGAELCEVRSLQHQFWDVTDPNPANHFQLDASTVTTSYAVGSIDGAELELDNVSADVDLELRRVFINPDGYPVNVNNCNVTLPIDINVDSGDPPTDATFTITPPISPLQDCYNYQFSANTAYDFHEWDFIGDSTPEISGPGTEIAILNPSFTFPSDGIYVITHTVTNGCGSLSSQQTIIVDCIDPILNISKEAFALSNPNASISTVYVGSQFEWRVTIENNVPGYALNYADIFPDDSTVDCGFTIVNIDVELDGVDTGDVIDPSNLNGTLILGVGITEIRFYVIPCSDSSYSGTLFENCFTYEDPNSISDPPGIIEVCDEVLLAYGCPAALSDGYCLEPKDLEEGDIITSDFNLHISFSDIVKMEGDLVFDPTLFDGASISPDFFVLDPLIASTTTETYSYPAPGIVHFIFETSPPFNIGVGGTFTPFSVTLELLEDLTDCTTILINNFEFTEDSGDVFPIFVDPGEFCFEFDDTYESAWIITPPGDTCADDGSVELTVIGPFDSSHPDTTYLWSTGATTQTILVTANGTYSVAINDNLGCDRFASFEVTDCYGQQCVCGGLNPEIVWFEEDCYVTATANLPSCDNIESINYTWTFSNGVTYNGEFPPPQAFIGSNGGDNSITLEISYEFFNLPGKCYEMVIEDIFVPCRNGKKEVTNIHLFPNPAKDNVTVRVDSESKGGTITLVNLFGRTLETASYDISTSHKEITLNISRLPSGVYFVKHTSDDGTIVIKRLVIE